MRIRGRANDSRLTPKRDVPQQQPPRARARVDAPALPARARLEQDRNAAASRHREHHVEGTHGEDFRADAFMDGHDHDHDHGLPIGTDEIATLSAPIKTGAPSEPIGEALESGQAVEFTNGAGQTETVAIASGGQADGKDVYVVTTGDSQLEVQIPPNHDPAAVLGEVVDYYTQVPANLRPALEHVVIENGRNPQDEYWAEQYDRPGFTSAATGGGGTITFWNGTGAINEDVFNHEAGHNIGSWIDENEARPSFLDRTLGALGLRSLPSDDERLPNGWTDAIEADGAVFDDYALNSPSEDFAVHYEAYIEAQQESPEALARFQAGFPHRTRLIEQLIEEGV